MSKKGRANAAAGWSPPKNASFDDMPANVRAAIRIIVDNGPDAAHHMMWTMDQALRALMGDEYDAWRDTYDLWMARREYSVWSEGVAP